MQHPYHFSASLRGGGGGAAAATLSTVVQTLPEGGRGGGQACVSERDRAGVPLRESGSASQSCSLRCQWW